MAEVTRAVAKPTLSTPYPSPEHRVSGLLAGEAIVGGDACYIKAADGLVWKATGAAVNEAARVVGFAGGDSSVGEAVSLYHHVNIGYGPRVGGNPVAGGVPLFLSGTVAGGLADAASTGGTTAIAVVLDSSRIFAKGNY